MRFQAEAGGRTASVTIRGEGGRYELTIGERRIVVDARRTSAHSLSLLIDGRSYDIGLQKAEEGYHVRLAGGAVAVRLADAFFTGAMRAAGGSMRLVAPMPGKIVRVLVAAGDAVDAGAGLVVVEAMKMENELRAARPGRVRAVHVREGQPVEGGALLVELE
jgi:biotin carboxyl carrier protein